MKRERLIKLLVPIITFVLGIIAQILIERSLTTNISKLEQYITLGLAGIIVAFTTFVILAIFLLGGLDETKEEIVGNIGVRFAHVEKELLELSSRGGILVEYIEEGRGENAGVSYVRAKQLIESAQHSIRAIDFWVRYEDYQEGDSQVKDRRLEYYEAIRSKIKAHINDGEPFHQRIVQIPSSVLAQNKTIPFWVDKVFADYLLFSAQVQQTNPRCSLLKIAPAQLLTHYTIIDNRWVIWPILTSDPSGSFLTRHGVLVFDDTKGNLVDCLVGIYRIINSQASPLHIEDLEFE